eukprot:GEMP01035263.1.p1 GENE.GEMP01035263.1~~GEMP01035263.1.p1  ORF type:complete len:490 (+),score=62.19 GEMP01035263.1:181-1650(+)
MIVDMTPPAAQPRQSTPPPEYPPNKQLKTVYHGLCLNNRYEIRRLVGEGSFAEIWEAMDLKTETSVALKLLNKDLDKAVLQKQKKSLNDLVREIHRENTDHAYISCCASKVPSYLDWNVDDEYGPFIVMGLLGADLGAVRNRSKQRHHKMTIACVAKLGLGAIDCLEDIHRSGYVHRDLKPQNFLLGSLGSGKEMEVFMTDFGFVKRHLDPITGQPFLAVNMPHFRGTLPYASVRAQQFRDQGRRDDVEGLFFVLMELLLGGLPWTKLIHAGADREQVLQMKIEFLKAAKELHRRRSENLTPQICRDDAYCGPTNRRVFEIAKMEQVVSYLPEQMIKFLIYANGLRYESKPDYQVLRLYLADMGEVNAAACNDHFQTTSVQDSYKKELLLPQQEELAKNDRDCMGFWNHGICLVRHCKAFHARTAAPKFILDAFRGKRNRAGEDLGITGSPRRRIVPGQVQVEGVKRRVVAGKSINHSSSKHDISTPYE